MSGRLHEPEAALRVIASQFMVDRARTTGPDVPTCRERHGKGPRRRDRSGPTEHFTKAVRWLIPRVEPKRRELLTVADVRRIGDEIDGDWRPLPVLGGATGMRLGELFGLQVGDVDFARKVVHIRRSIDRHGHAVPLKGKPVGFERVAPLPDEVVHALVAHVRDRGLGVDDRLFPGTAGRFCTEQWTPAVHRAELDGVTPHALRHGAASLMISRGIALATVSKILGNTTQVLSSVYVRAMASDDRVARSVLNAAWSGSGTSVARQRRSERDPAP